MLARLQENKIHKECKSKGKIFHRLKAAVQLQTRPCWQASSERGQAFRRGSPLNNHACNTGRRLHPYCQNTGGRKTC